MLPRYAVSQDLQYGCITCGDKYDKCELDCAWSLQDLNSTFTDDCQAGCLETKGECVDSLETMQCSLCVLECSQKYDSDMRVCLSQVSRLTKATFGDSLSDCELIASFDMDSCILKCKTSNEVGVSDDQGDDNFYTPGR